MRSLVIITEANAEVGLGHFMRCSALAEVWKAEVGKVIFVARKDSDLAKLACNKGFDVAYSNTWMTLPSTWIVVDGYNFGSRLHHRIRRCGHKLLVIDDDGRFAGSPANLILNHMAGADQLEPYCGLDTRLLLGTSYALIRSEVVARRKRRKIKKAVCKVLVTLGAGCQGKVPMHVAKVLHQIGNLTSVIVSGNTMDLPMLMTWADVGIIGGGVTLLEAACLGLPTLSMVIAGNQKWNVLGMDAVGGTLKTSLPRLSGELNRLLGDYALRRSMSKRAMKLVDGQGARRVACEMT